jgi:hypothetical protein
MSVLVDGFTLFASPGASSTAEGTVPVFYLIVNTHACGQRRELYRTEPCGKVKDEVNFASLMFPPVSAEFDLPSGLKCEHISEWIAVMQRGQSREPDW